MFPLDTNVCVEYLRGKNALIRQRLAACPREEALVVGRNTAPREPVQEDRHRQLLGQSTKRGLAMRPVEPCPGHDHRPLGPRQQLSRLLHAVGRRQSAAVDQRRALVIGQGALAEDVVEREIEERGAGRVVLRLRPPMPDQTP